MLQGVRDNLKGTLMVIVVVIFIVPMVISGVGSAYLGDIAGTDAASVNGESITKQSLANEVEKQRRRLLQQGAKDLSDSMLSDEVLGPKVLDSLLRKTALITKGENAGMAISEKSFANFVKDIPDFQEDGKFNRQAYNRVLALNGINAAEFKKQVMRDLVIQQQNSGLALSAFSTTTEQQDVIGILEQTRSYFGIKLDRSSVAGHLEPTEADIQAYYQENQARFTVPEKIKVQYLELNLDALAQSEVVSKEEVDAQYELEIKNFKSDTQYEIAQILIEDPNSEKVTKVSEALAAGRDFAELAKTYSDDIATNEDGGYLGVFVADVYPSEFDAAVKALDKGEVSAPVKSDDGIHFIKVIEKNTLEIPSLASREVAIRNEIARSKAFDSLRDLTEQLGEYTFSSDGLDEAASQLGLKIQQSAYFDRNEGTGIASEALVRTAAFSDDVYQDGHNSNVIEISPEQFLVVRVFDKKASYVKSFEEVKALVVAGAKNQIQSDAVEEKAKDLKKRLEMGESLDSLMLDTSLSLKEVESAARSSADVDPELNYYAFLTQATEGKPVHYSINSSRDGGVWLIGITAVKDASLEELPTEKVVGYSRELANASAAQEAAVYERNIFASSKVKVH